MGPGNSKGPKLTVVKLKANLGCRREQPIHTQAAHEKILMIAQSARHQGGLGTRLILPDRAGRLGTGAAPRSQGRLSHVARRVKR